MNKKGLLYGGVAVGVLVLAIVIYLALDSKKDKETVKAILGKLDSGAGAGGTDLKSILADVSPQQFSQASQYAQDIEDAKSWGFIPDEDSVVLDTIKGLSKPQIKAVMNEFSGDMDKYLNPALDGFMDEENWDKLISIVKKA